ncbi:MAG: hypothetical protein IPM35_02465 [Myxococcales bacterium]|nr:hypothetical protein [Myxococcales bacterium]
MIAELAGQTVPWDEIESAARDLGTHYGVDVDSLIPRAKAALISVIRRRLAGGPEQAANLENHASDLAALNLSGSEPDVVATAVTYFEATHPEPTEEAIYDFADQLDLHAAGALSPSAIGGIVAELCRRHSVPVSAAFLRLITACLQARRHQVPLLVVDARGVRERLARAGYHCLRCGAPLSHATDIGDVVLDQDRGLAAGVCRGCAETATGGAS